MVVRAEPEGFCSRLLGDAYGLGLMEKLRACSIALAKWGRDLARKFRRNIDDVKRQLEVLRARDDAASIEEFETCKA